MYAVKDNSRAATITLNRGTDVLGSEDGALKGSTFELSHPNKTVGFVAKQRPVHDHRREPLVLCDLEKFHK
jgi:hypothetical protein